MNIQQFKYVLAVVDLQNFEAAAERCSVTQSTLSTMIGRLEDEMGIRIFNRKTKPVSITPEGEQLISRLRIILNEIDSLNNLVQELKGEMVGELKIGIIPTIAPYLLPLFLLDLSRQFPRVNIQVKELTTQEIHQALKMRTIDVGILAIPLQDPDLDETELYTEPFMIYDCRELTNDSKVSVETLDYSKLCLLREGHCLRTQVHQICEMSDELSKNDVNYKFESGSMDSLLRLTRMRQGITIIPYLATVDLRPSEKLKLREFESPVPGRTVGLVTHKFFVKKRLLEGLKDVIQDSVADLIPNSEVRKVLTPV